MIDPARLATNFWKDAESLIDRLDSLARNELSQQKFFDEVARGIRPIVAARAVWIWVQNSDQRQVLAREGVLARDGGLDCDGVLDCDGIDGSAEVNVEDGPSRPIVGNQPLTVVPAENETRWLSTMQCRAIAAINDSSFIAIDLKFDHAVELTHQRPVAEMIGTIAEVCLTVYLRRQYTIQQRTENALQLRDETSIELNRGIGLSDTFSRVSQVIAKRTGVDRVCLLRCADLGKKPPTFRLMASSTSPSIDRRSRFTRRIEDLSAAVALHGDDLFVTVGHGQPVDGSLCKSLYPYMMESGSRQIAVRVLAFGDHGCDDAVAIVLERFTLLNESSTIQDTADRIDANDLSPLKPFDSIEPLVAQALLQAILRDRARWGRAVILREFAQLNALKKIALALLLGGVLIALLGVVPVDFWVQAEGRLVASQIQSLYAPADGVVTELFVDNGDQVAPGDRICVIRSLQLDAIQQRIEGEIATAQASLASTIASRGSNRDRLGEPASTPSSANEQVLKARLEGLNRQLGIVLEQQEQLTVRANLNGLVDHWNMRQNLSSRPVVRGQFLGDVIAPDAGWIVEVDVRDSDSGYLLQSQQTQANRCRFVLRSHSVDGSDRVYDGILESLDPMTHQNSQGEWVVKGRVRCVDAEPTADQPLRIGATTRVEILAGRRPALFVWFRGIFEWFRSGSIAG